MTELGCRLDFSLKASHSRSVFGYRWWQHLDRHDSLHAAMLGLEDLPHAAGPDLVEDRCSCPGSATWPGPGRFPGPGTWSGALLWTSCRASSSGVFGMSLGRNEIFQLARRNDARVGKLLDELFEGNGHRRNPAQRKSSFNLSTLHGRLHRRKILPLLRGEEQCRVGLGHDRPRYLGYRSLARWAATSSAGRSCINFR